MTEFKDPNAARRMAGPFFLGTPGGRLVAQTYDHADGSCTLQVKDGRWLTHDGLSKLIASKHFPDMETADLDAEVRALGYEPEGDEWGYTGAACWFDPEGWKGENTESYGVVLRDPAPTHFLAEVDGNDHRHSALKSARVTLCGQDILAPMGAGVPTCPVCRRELGMPEEEESK